MTFSERHLFKENLNECNKHCTMAIFVCTFVAVKTAGMGY